VSNTSTLSNNAQSILEKRYLWKDENGKLIEHTWEDLCERVSRVVAGAEGKFSHRGYNPHVVANKFFEMMVNRRVIANTPT
jgi:ribonucleoside-diphosphate reductase alpha chain